MIGEITSLHPVFRFAVERILADMRTRGWDPVIGSGMRTHAQQDALFAQGRMPLNDVNAMRRAAGLPPISAADNTRVVTNARGGQSNHNRIESMVPHGRAAVDITLGYAVDIVDRRYGWNIPNTRFWDDLGVLAKKHGCSWGGDWRNPDRAHVEMKIIDSAPRTSVAV